MQYYLSKLMILWWISRLITRDSEAILAMTGGRWGNSMRDVVIDMVLAEANKNDNAS